MLAPSGVLAGLWNVLDDRVEWIAELQRIAGRAAIGPRDTFGSWRAATAKLHLPAGDGPATFGAPDHAAFPHVQPRTADTLVDALGTRAGVLVMPEAERHALLDRIRMFLASRPETANGEFSRPLLTGVLRVQQV